MISIREITSADSEQWNIFIKENVANLPELKHHAFSFNWKLIFENTFGHKGYYLVAEESSIIVGILPLIHMNSFIFGSALISLPYLNAGGIVAKNEEAARALYNFACSLGKKLNVKYIELRHQKEISYYQKTTSRSHKISMILKTDSNPEKIFQSFSPKLRSQIRRPSKSGCYIEFSGNQLDIEDSLSAFYKVFSKHMLNLGTPVYPKKLFSEVARYFDNDCVIYSVWHDGYPISAAITITSGDYTEVPWAASLSTHKALSPNMLLYWEMIKNSVLNGTKLFDFGRSSPNSGTHKFKEQWGAKPVELNWYYPDEFIEIPDVNPSSKKFSILVSCWKFLPQNIANLVGPIITKNIP